ncbi:RNA-binding S4 domain-containing protein [Kaustia mangrovi]|uniref:RNA-binding S4 domain-containing protein n=1 Tax=Kaustia mangrovi TaxID=2593653 RepID=A0A7S8C4I6_9HYPH|nr:RNA-binding S4 domain-containing protein [Kaustia mangrovi]QPC43206.1 RNA-binding S4 domain-containing protein [Kaustia mangrovi]
MTLDRQRIDKWLFYARFLKTRSAAARLVDSGKLKVNRQRVSKPSHTVSPGDVLTFALHRQVRVVRVVAPGTRRGPAPEARTLYEDLSPEPETAGSAAPAPAAARPAGAGRPTKRDRRQLDTLRNDGGDT